VSSNVCAHVDDHITRLQDLQVLALRPRLECAQQPDGEVDTLPEIQVPLDPASLRLKLGSCAAQLADGHDDGLHGPRDEELLVGGERQHVVRASGASSLDLPSLIRLSSWRVSLGGE
jgi:hypothetical protein